MAHTLQSELDLLEKQLLTLSAVVEQSLHHAAKALRAQDVDLARKVIKNDDQINRMEVDLEEECLKILALHQPVAHDLRTIIAILKINNDLERIADLSANICERVLDVAEAPTVNSPLEIEVMVLKVVEMLEKALDALINADNELAERTLALDEDVDTIHSGNYQLFKDRVRQHPEEVASQLNYLTISRHLERIADLATNIAEYVIYLNKGTIVRHQKV
ncbi:MAG TPA: phosphate signaling complex protein PhoU [Desulfuromonadales bacterium]|nr:phosphate signaling complex protein PhoU [Desulfuromonadales bacterium]